MKIVVVSDTHNSQNKLVLPKADILIHCGDWTGRGTEWEFKLVQQWLEGICDDYDHIIGIGGNHDFGLQTNREDIVKKYLTPENFIYLQDEEFVYKGVKFYGSPWTPMFNNWAFMQNDDELAQVWNKIPEDTDVLITHGPPKSILDRNQEGELCGSETLYNRVKRLDKLKAHVFGHIHEGYGQVKIDTTTFYNCSILNRAYQIQNKPTIIEL